MKNPPPDPEREARDAYRVARAREVLASIAADAAHAAYTALRYGNRHEARIVAYATMHEAGAELAARRADVQTAVARVAAISAGADTAQFPTGTAPAAAPARASDG